MRYKEKKINLQIWNTGGLEKYRFLLCPFLNETNTVMIVFDLTNKQSFNNIESTYLPMVQQDCPKAKVIFVGTKMDIKKNLWMVTEEDIKSLAEKRKCKYILTSAKENKNIKKAFEKAAKLSLSIPQNDDPKPRQALKEALQKYIKRVENDLEEKSDYTHGFWFRPMSRAKNRIANYNLAQKLIEQLDDRYKSIQIIFSPSSISTLRGGGTVRSNDLKSIIAAAQNGTKINLDKFKKSAKEKTTLLKR